jgi:hypothetical protein
VGCRIWALHQYLFFFYMGYVWAIAQVAQCWTRWSIRLRLVRVGRHASGNFALYTLYYESTTSK